MYDVTKYKVYTYDETRPDGSHVPVVCAVSTYAGKTVKGYAKLSFGDKYDFEAGRKLAIARCNEKIAKKRLKRATSKVGEAQEILEDAVNYLNDMINYQSDAVNEVSEASVMVAKVLAKM